MLGSTPADVVSRESSRARPISFTVSAIHSKIIDGVNEVMQEGEARVCRKTTSHDIITIGCAGKPVCNKIIDHNLKTNHKYKCTPRKYYHFTFLSILEDRL